jgi:hypothetical protein
VNIRKKSKKRIARKAKPLKATYRELLDRTLTTDLYIEENRLLKEIVNVKYQTKRAKKSKQLSVLNNLKSGLESGDFRRLEEGSKKFWRRGDGTVVRQEKIATEGYDAPARAAAARIEKFLYEVSVEMLQHARNFSIPYKNENEMLNRYKSANHGKEPNSKLDLLKHGSISDLGWVISENWSYFEDLFKNKRNFVSKIQEINEYRRRLAHPNLGALDAKEAEYFSLSVLLFIRNTK